MTQNSKQQQASLEDFETTLVPGSVKKAMGEAGASSRDLWQIERKEIHVLEHFNVRIRGSLRHAERIRALADSMKTEGYYPSKPLEGYTAKVGDTLTVYLTDGHRRLEAYDLAVSEGAELGRLPMVMVPAGASMEDLTVGLARHNNLSEPLTPYELAVVCKRLSRFGWDADAIGLRLGVSAKYVDDLLFLVSSDLKLRHMVIEEEVSASVAIEALRKYGDKAYEKLAESLAKIKAAGGGKVTRKHLPEAVFKRKVTKAAPTLFNVMREVKHDPGYGHISEELRGKLDKLLSELDALMDAGKEPEKLPGEAAVA